MDQKPKNSAKEKVERETESDKLAIKLDLLAELDRLELELKSI